MLDPLLPSVKATQYQALIVGFYDLLAKSLLAIKEHLLAENHAINLLETEQQHHYQPAIASAYRILAEVHEYRKNYKQALYFYTKYSEAEQIELSQNNIKLLAIQKIKLNVIEKNIQIALLGPINTLLKIQALLGNTSVHKRRLALAFLSMTLVVIILWIYKTEKFILKHPTLLTLIS